MIKKLTPEQEQKMQEVKNFWLDYIFSCKNQTNREAANIGIEWLYKLAGYDKPIIIYVDSPFGCQYAVAYLKEFVKQGFLNKDRSQVGSQVWSQVESQVESQVRSQVWSQVRSQVGSQVWSQVRSQVGSQVWSQVGSQVESQVWSQVESQVRFEYFASYGNIFDYGWVSFYDFFREIGVHNSKEFEQFKNILLSGVYDMIQLNGFCIVSNLPNKIYQNNERLHNTTDAAIEFRDGYKQYYINGRAIPAEVFEKATGGKYTKKEFLAEKNSEVKGAIYEIYGQKKMLDLLGASEVDTQQIVHKNGDIETVTLLKTKEKFAEIDNQPFAWVKMICPSTSSQYLQGVQPLHTNALEAIASLSPFKKEEYSFNYRS